MTEQSQQVAQQSGFWDALSNFMDRLAEIEVSLFTVLVLFAVYSLRELVGLYLKWRAGK